MTSATRTAIRAILATDPSISQEALARALAVLEGKTDHSDHSDQAVTASEAARLLKVCTKTLRSYQRRGLIRAVGTPDARGNVRRYSLRSIQVFIGGEVR